MTPNEQVVARYMDAFGRSDHAQVLACLTDDVEWDIPGAFSIKGKEAFDRHIEGEGFVGSPAISVSRMLEADGIVVAEGRVRTRRADGTLLDLAFCDLFEMRGGLIFRLRSYLMELR